MSTCPSICESATSTSLKRRSKNFAAPASTGPSPGSKRASKTTSEAPQGRSALCLNPGSNQRPVSLRFAKRWVAGAPRARTGIADERNRGNSRGGRGQRIAPSIAHHR